MAKQLLPSRGRQSLGRLAVLWLVAVTAAVRQCHFDLEAAGMLPASLPSQALQGVSGLALCATACLDCLGLRCLSLAYSQEQRECRLYSVFDPSDVTVTSAGHKYYRGCPKRVGDACGGDAECSVANSQCRLATCQCVIGFHFHPHSGTCLEVCPNGYGPGFYAVDQWALSEHNDVIYGDVTLAQCEAWCRADPRCSSLDFHASNAWCALSYSDLPQIPPGAFVADPAFVYHQRDCA